MPGELGLSHFELIRFLLQRERFSNVAIHCSFGNLILLQLLLDHFRYIQNYAIKSFLLDDISGSLKQDA